jgi:hypothetical protein
MVAYSQAFTVGVVPSSQEIGKGFFLWSSFCFTYFHCCEIEQEFLLDAV